MELDATCIKPNKLLIPNQWRRRKCSSLNAHWNLLLRIWFIMWETQEGAINKLVKNTRQGPPFMKTRRPTLNETMNNLLPRSLRDPRPGRHKALRSRIQPRRRTRSGPDPIQDSVSDFEWFALQIRRLNDSGSAIIVSEVYFKTLSPHKFCLKH